MCSHESLFLWACLSAHGALGPRHNPRALPNSPSVHRKNLLQWLPLALFAAVMLTVSPKADGFDIRTPKNSAGCTGGGAEFSLELA